jgi:hypothetical protein
MPTINQLRQSGAEIFIVRLRDLTRKDVKLAGAKAAILGELMRAGLPVQDARDLNIQELSLTP